MVKILTVEVISQATSDDFAFSMDDSAKEDSEGICAYRDSSSSVQEATQFLATNFFSNGPSTDDKVSSVSDDELPLFEGTNQEDFSSICKYLGPVFAF